MLSVPPTFYHDLDEAREQGQDFVEMDLTVASPEAMQQVREQVQESGGTMLLEDRTYAQVRVPLAAADTLPTRIPAVAVGLNKPTAVGDRATLTPASTGLERAALAGLIVQNLNPSQILSFRQQHGVSGDGVKIAVVDSGIDPGHSDLLRTPNGQPKLVDWKDFTGEGAVKADFPVEWQETYTISGRTYKLPPRPAASQAARFGFWDESKVHGVINSDLDRNGRRIDTFGVLLVDSLETGVYDLVYVDTNNDKDFTDERPLRVYRSSYDVGRLGRFRTGAAAEEQLNFVVADIDPAGRWVQFGFDGHGHGTQVAGVLAAYSEDGLTGVAPGAQLMALKVINSQDQGPWFQVQEAIRYAAEQGASIINVSLGGLPIATAYDSAASERLNQLARQYNVLIVLASDNTGPGFSSGMTIGSPNEILMVGAYYSPEMWQRDYGFVVPSEGIWWRTGMGPRLDGSYVPNLVAPGGSPTTMPRWRESTGYTTAAGTSIAVPHVSGSAALLMEAARRAGLPFDRLTIKRALEFGARKLSGVEVFEQGSGLLQLDRSFELLRGLRPISAISSPTPTGGGVLARSYRPGSSAIQLINQSGKLTRVSVSSSHPWVRPALRSLTMPAGEPRELRLDFDPPETPGVHSAFVSLHSQDGSGPLFSIPITYVRPVALTERERTYTTTDRIEVARYSRYFVEVTPGAPWLQVSTSVLTGAQGASQGTVLVQVFRPDGQLAFRSSEIGYGGTGLSAVYRADQPLEGVWEVVVTALPDTEGLNTVAGYNLEIESPRGPASWPLRLTVPAATTTTQTIRLTNPMPAFVGRAEAYGLVQRDDSKPWTVVRETGVIDSFTLSTTAALLRLEVDDILPASTNLVISLYRRGESDPVATSPANFGPVLLYNLRPGQYQVFVTGAQATGVQYQYRRQVAPLAYNLGLKDANARHERGQSWSVPLTVYAPNIPGRYKGQVVLVDDKGDTVAWIPVEVSVDQPSLTVSPLVSQLQVGETGTVVLEVRDSATQALVEGTVTVNGRRYLARRGRVTVNLRPADLVEKLQIEIDLPKYQFYRNEIQVPVQKTRAAYPTGIDTSPENSLWRRKVESLFQ